MIKQFVPQVQGTAALEKATELFKQEARRLYELGEHPQIPRLIAYFEQDKRLYLVQELIEGQTLLEELQQQGAFSEEKIQQLLADLLPVLKIVHERGVIHRDIKPENIMRRCKDGKLMLIDFGVSKQVTATLLNQAGTTVGTHGYAPMEQMRGQVYPASDLYSLGVTCIRLLTQRLPKEDGSDELYDALNGRWIWRERLPQSTTVSPQLGQVLNKLTQDYVKVRYQSADEVLQAFNPESSTPSNSSAVTPVPINMTFSYDLNSATVKECSKLQELLARGKWQEADEETQAVMFKVFGYESIFNASRYQEKIKIFPYENLCKIDQLWVQHSNGRFGFSVQKRIWKSVDKKWDFFGDRVGWRVDGNWLSYNNLTFTLDAPVAHLPGLRDLRYGRWLGRHGLWVQWWVLLFSRVEACRL